MAYVKRYASRADRTFRKLDNLNNLNRFDKCDYCGVLFNGSIKPTLDHVVPLARVHRMHSNQNITGACSFCNTHKSDSVEYEAKEFRLSDAVILNAIEMRIRRAEYNLDLNANMTFNKWLKYHKKRNRWGNKVTYKEEI